MTAAVFCSGAIWMAAAGCSGTVSVSTSPSQGSSVKVSVQANDARLLKSYRFDRGGWIYLHAEGTPSQIGFQHGYWLAHDIEDMLNAYRVDVTHESGRDWNFFRETSRNILWPKIEQEYREELQGIVDGVNSQGVKADLDDIVSLNASLEIPGYYVPWLDKQQHRLNAPKLTSPGNCSAFVATGSYTKDRGIVIAHNNWTDYWQGERWRVIFDLVPTHGNRIVMDGFPGVIVSDDDFGVNSQGIMITETTISQFSGFDPNGVPEFVRARKALQYSTSIDDYVRIMLEQNNGGYANDWLLGDRKTGEVARFELGLKDHQVWRTKDGYFVGSNFASDPKLIKDETKYNPNDHQTSANARHARWDQLMQEYKGKIDVAAAQKFLGDHTDVGSALPIDRDQRFNGNLKRIADPNDPGVDCACRPGTGRESV